MKTIQDMMKDLAQARQREADLKAKLDAARAEFDAMHAELIDSHKKAKEILGTVESAVRAAAELAYEENGEKRPADGVEVKLYDDVVFASDVARTWAMEHMPDLLILDEKAYAKALKEIKGSTVLAGLINMPGTLTTTAKATVARDLSAYLSDGAS